MDNTLDEQETGELFYVSENGLVSAVTTIQNDPGTLFDPDDPNVQVNQHEQVIESEDGEIVVMTSGDVVSITKASPAKGPINVVQEIVVDSETPTTSQEPEVSRKTTVIKEERTPTSSSPTKKQTAKVCKENPYNDPVDPNAKFTFRMFNCLRDVETIIERVQEEVGLKYFCLNRGKHFGVEDDWDHTKMDKDKPNARYRIQFRASNYDKALGRISLPLVPEDTVPFLAVSSCIMCCEHMRADCQNSLKSKKVLEYRKKVEAGEIIHVEPPPPPPKAPKVEPQQYEYFEDEEDVTAAAFLLETIQSGEFSTNSPKSPPKKRSKAPYKRKSGILPPGVSRFRESKKTDCTAALCVRQIVTFPDYKLPRQFMTQKKRLQQMNRELRAKLEANEGFAYEMRYYVRIPNSWAHSGHPINIENPKYISHKFRDHVMNYLMHLKEKELLSDIKFNVPDQKRPVKLHSAVLACCGSKVRDYLLTQDYGGLAEMLMPLNKDSLDAFFKFVYSGRLEITPGVDLDVLESVFLAGGIKEGAQLCSDHKSNPKPPNINNWSITNKGTPVRYSKGEIVKTESDLGTTSSNAVVGALADHGSLFKKTLSPFMDVTKGLVHQAAHQIYDTLCHLFVREDTRIMCERIEQLWMTENDSKAVMQKIMLERLDQHLSGKLKARPPKFVQDKGTSMHQEAPQQLVGSPISLPTGFGSMPFIILPGNPLSQMPTPKASPLRKRASSKNAIHVDPEDVRGAKSKIIDVSRSMKKLDHKERMQQEKASSTGRSQSVQIYIEQLDDILKARESKGKGPGKGPKVELANVLQKAEKLSKSGKNKKGRKNTRAADVADKGKEVGKKTEDAENVAEIAVKIAENAQPATEDKDLVAENAESLTDDMESVTEDAHPVTEDAQPVTEDAENITEDAQSVLLNAEPDAEDAEPVTGDAETSMVEAESSDESEEEVIDIPELDTLLAAAADEACKEKIPKPRKITMKKSKSVFVKNLGLSKGKAAAKPETKKSIVPGPVEIPVTVQRRKVTQKRKESPLETKRVLKVILKRTEVGSKRKADVEVKAPDAKKSREPESHDLSKGPSTGRARRTVKAKKTFDL